MTTAVLNAARQAGGAMGVAMFGSLAGDVPAQIVSGLHGAAFIAAALLGLAAIGAAATIGGRRDPRRQGRGAAS